MDRLVKGMKKVLGDEEVRVDFSLIDGVTRALRKHDYEVSAALFQEHSCWHLIDVFSTQGGNGIYGLALDLGSSTLVLRLMDLESGGIMDEISFHNPQIEIGADILTRIHFADQDGGLIKLQNILIGKLNEEINRLTKKHGISSESIAGMSVAGNTTMTHLFMGLDPYWICREPYIPIANTVNISLREIRKFYVAGTFGSYIDPQSAITIGMIPDLPLETYVSLGNTSLNGAGMALLRADAKDELFRIRDQITYLELNVNQEFMNLFSAAKFIPHTDRSLFPSVKTGSF